MSVTAPALPSSVRTWPRESRVSGPAAFWRSGRRHIWPPSWVWVDRRGTQSHPL